MKYELILLYKLKKIVEENTNFYNYEIDLDIWREIIKHEEYEKIKKFLNYDFDNAKIKIFAERQSEI